VGGDMLRKYMSYTLGFCYPFFVRLYCLLFLNKCSLWVLYMSNSYYRSKPKKSKQCCSLVEDKERPWRRWLMVSVLLAVATRDELILWYN
jgi:hypothetical protein